MDDPLHYSENTLKISIDTTEKRTWKKQGTGRKARASDANILKYQLGTRCWRTVHNINMQIDSYTVHLWGRSLSVAIYVYIRDFFVAAQKHSL